MGRGVFCWGNFVGLIRSLFEARTHPSDDGINWGRLFGLSADAKSGVVVTEQNALSSMAVLACVRVIAESVAQLPLLTLRRREGEPGKDRAADHPLYDLLHALPNPEMTTFELRETMAAHVCTWGNAYAEIEWGGGGRVLALWPLRPDRMKVRRERGELYYYYTMPGMPVQRLPSYRIMHLRGLGSGVLGYSPVRMAMEAIGLSLATEEFGARFFSNGARPGFIVKHPGILSDTAYDRLKNSFEDAHRGLSNAHRTKILEEGMDVTTVGVPPEEAQFLETRRFQLNEVARMYRVPPHMVGDLTHATFSNIEHQSIDFVVHSLNPWLVRIEQAMMRDLLTEGERRSIVIEHLVDGLLRGDIETRYKSYATGRQWGWLSVNDIRARENMNPVEDGDEYLVPLNMAPAGELPEQEDARRMSLGSAVTEGLPVTGRSGMRGSKLPSRREDDPDGPRREGRQKLARSYVRLYEDVATRVVRREVNDLRRAVGKHLRKRSVQSFRDWLQDFYTDFPNVLEDGFASTMRTLADQVADDVIDELGEDVGSAGVDEFVESYLEKMANGHVASSRRQIEQLIDTALIDEADPASVIEQRLDEWEEKRPGKMGLQQAFEAMNALTIFFYGAAGVTLLRWAGGDCNFCKQLSGQVVGIQEYFVVAGSSLDGGDAGTMRVRNNTRHGPLHRGCDCVVVAG